MRVHLRIARPVNDIQRSVAQYTAGLGLSQLGAFKDHEGFDGAMVGGAGMDYHLEFTLCRNHPQAPKTTPEDLLVFYIPEIDEWERACASMHGAGFKEVDPFNPYWAKSGRTFQDLDGYHVVLQRENWVNKEVTP